MTERIGTLEDVGKSVCVCDVCDYVAWDGGRDGDPCPACEEREPDEASANTDRGN